MFHNASATGWNAIITSPAAVKIGCSLVNPAPMFSINGGMICNAPSASVVNAGSNALTKSCFTL